MKTFFYNIGYFLLEASRTIRFNSLSNQRNRIYLISSWHGVNRMVRGKSISASFGEGS